MTKETVDTLKLLLEVIQTIVILLAAFWTYMRFFREGVHRDRIEMDIACEVLETSYGQCALAFRISATNRGHIDFRFPDLRLRVRGMKRGQELTTKEIQTLTGGTPYLEFTEGEGKSHSIIPKSARYFFVRPGVTQHFSYAMVVPASWSMVSARATFKYPRTNELHTAEKVFRLKGGEPIIAPDASGAKQRTGTGSGLTC
jgi:hypothetical protein